MTVPRPCIECGVPCPATRCSLCGADRQRLLDQRRGHAAARGYDAAWRVLAARARRLVRHCDDCGSRDDLTVDHLPGAWEKRARGERLTLADVSVCCRSCNSRRGARRARGAIPDRRD